MRKSIGVAGATLLVVGLLVGVEGSTTAPASAATTQRLVSSTTIAGTADNVRAITHSSAAAGGIVAASGDPLSIAQAGALASITGETVIVSASTTNASAVNSVVASKNITKLTFVGNAGVFGATYRNSVDARVTTKNLALNNSPYERSKLLTPAGQTAFVVAKSADTAALAAAISYASATDSSLLVMTGSEPADSLRSFVAPLTDPRVALAGELQVAHELDPDDGDYLVELRVSTAELSADTYDKIVQLHVDKKGRAATRVSTAPGNDIASFALAAVLGRFEGSVTIPAGATSAISTDSPANAYLNLVRAEAQRVSLVGTSTTSAQLAAVAAPTGQARNAAPAWTITNTTLGSGTYTVTYTARSNATSYKVLNFDNTVAASSSTTSISLPGTPDFMTLVAYDAAGSELERIYYRSNGYTSSAERSTVVTGTIQNGTANLRILGSTGVPRKIVRTMHDPYATMDAERPAPVTVAITCATSFTDTGLDPQRQWSYEVVNLTLKTGTGCGNAAGTPVSGQGLPVGGLALPLTEDPWATSMSARSAEDLSAPREDATGAERLLPRAGQTVSDVARQEVAYNKAHPAEAEATAENRKAQSADSETQMTTSAASSESPGSGFVFSYQAYIPGRLIAGPGFSLEPTKPAIFFNASDRGVYDVNSMGTKFDIRAYVGGNEVFPTEHMGSTTRWHCGYDFQQDTGGCFNKGTRTASLDELNLSYSILPDRTRLTFTAAATNPMETFAQAIDGQMVAVLDRRQWRLTGTHDRMPVHQFWWAPLYSEGTLAYTSGDYYSLHCLFPNVPGCTARVNVSM